LTYYTSGKKESEGNYKAGKPEGLWIYYHENGNKASEGNMVDGKKEGPWRYYNINGRLEQIINFKNDEIVTQDDEMRSEIIFKFDN
jgi:antitoxin component YwqK of YwqJK toxin-antitoxin module